MRFLLINPLPPSNARERRATYPELELHPLPSLQIPYTDAEPLRDLKTRLRKTGVGPKMTCDNAEDFKASGCGSGKPNEREEGFRPQRWP
jgi:hypothetical protein